MRSSGFHWTMEMDSGPILLRFYDLLENISVNSVDSND